MKYYAQYSLTDGFINAVVTSLAAELPDGRGQVEIPFPTDGSRHRINLDTMLPEEIPE